MYRLPSVSKTLNTRVNRWYSAGLDNLDKENNYIDLLLGHYRKSNPILLTPIENSDSKLASFIKCIILTTMRKLEKQAKLEGRNLPQVTQATLDSFEAGLKTGEQDPHNQLLNRYVKENEHLVGSIGLLVSEMPPRYKGYGDNIIRGFAYILGLLESQGDADELDEYFMLDD